MIAVKAAHLLILCRVILQVSAEGSTECPKFMHTCPAGCNHTAGPDGCATCECPKTCQYTTCPYGQKCVMITANCTEKPCDRQPTCVPDEEVLKNNNCTTAVCDEPCVADLGEDGCYSKCSCPQTCEDTPCKAVEVCKLVQVSCVRAPCFLVPTCVPKSKMCSQIPNVNRCRRPISQWTYIPRLNACRMFSFFGCAPSPNTFSDYSHCTATCVHTCPRIMCMENCYSASETPGACPECVCPCQAVRCPENTECRLKEGDCLKGKPCHPTAYCAPVPPTVDCEPVCDDYCQYGHVKDENGCDTCPCNDAPTAYADETGHV